MVEKVDIESVFLEHDHYDGPFEVIGDQSEPYFFDSPQRFRMNEIDIVRVKNIREFDVDHIEDLKESIVEMGLRYPLLADRVLIEGIEYVRIFAGQHRLMAFYVLEEEDLECIMELKISNRTLTEFEILKEQNHENKHHSMTPFDKAEVIQNLYDRVVVVEGKENATIGAISRMSGYDYGTVSDALKYAPLEPEIKKLAESRVLPYTVACALADVENTEDRPNRRLVHAIYIINNQMNRSAAIKYVKSLIGDGSSENMLFDMSKFEVGEKDLRMSLKNNGNKAAMSSMKWLVTMLNLRKSLPEDIKILLSDAIKNTLKDLDLELSDFKNEFPGSFEV